MIFWQEVKTFLKYILYYWTSIADLDDFEFGPSVSWLGFFALCTAIVMSIVCFFKNLKYISLTDSHDHNN